LRLEQLEVVGFRNLKDQKISLPAEATFIIGNNGQGKTSLLEAVFLLSHGKSFRSAKVTDLIRWPDPSTGVPGNYCLVSGLFLTANGKKSVTFEVKDGKRAISINGKRVEKAKNFYGQTRSVVFTPDELQLVKGPPALRRQFMDRILAMADSYYVESLVQYQRTIHSRNKVISDGAAKHTSAAQLSALLRSWDVLLARHATVIAKKRLDLSQEIQPYFAEFYSCLVSGGGAKEAVACRLHTELVADHAVLDEAAIVQLYAAGVMRDLRFGTTRLGPQRDDLQLLLDTGFGLRNSRQTASQGQGRCVALALKLAAAKLLLEHTGEAPILLLDDVESELDQTRRSALYKLLKKLSSQVIITSTEVSELVSDPELKSAALCISGGIVES
jgi:DNA replication and repair protein RecF